MNISARREDGTSRKGGQKRREEEGVHGGMCKGGWRRKGPANAERGCTRCSGYSVDAVEKAAACGCLWCSFELASSAWATRQVRGWSPSADVLGRDTCAGALLAAERLASTQGHALSGAHRPVGAHPGGLAGDGVGIVDAPLIILELQPVAPEVPAQTRTRTPAPDPSAGERGRRGGSPAGLRRAVHVRDGGRRAPAHGLARPHPDPFLCGEN